MLTMPMLWLPVVRSILYYVFLPLATIFNVFLAILAPVTHLATYTTHGLLYPLWFLGRFESLYIYFGVAALVGIVTGSILHFSSSLLTALFNLHMTPEETGRTAASARAAREKRKKLESAWDTSRFGWDRQQELSAEDLKKDYTDFLEKDRGKRREGQSLLAQTILEEDDDSEHGF